VPPVCPSCSIALDPTHAPVARIRGARVVTYCSVACADAPALASPADAKLGNDTPESESAVVAKTSEATKADDSGQVPTPLPPDGAESAPLHTLEPLRISASRRKRVLLASGAIMVGGMAIAVVQSISPSSPSSVSAGEIEAGTPQANVVVPAADPNRMAATSSENVAAEEEKPPSADELRALAIAELEGQLAEGSPRFKRLSGMALARIKHAGAIATLSELLTTETSDLSRIDIAYGLALAGDASGREYLVGELDSRRRDVRIDASRRLVQLGDDAGRKALHQMLGVRTHRLGAASVLALLGDEKGLQVLRETFESPKSSDENRMRSAVGLGFAGDPLAREHLLEILGEGKYVVDAAGALATLGDRAAVPALERQLLLTALRVGAAESLLSIKEDVDVTPLASALLKGNAEGRIAAAEAILVLGQ
jgi:hypothetical protein